MDPFVSAEEFRNLLYAISHPGEIVKLKTSYPYISILNRDVFFYGDTKEDVEFIRRYTEAVYTDIEEADYLIFQKEPDKNTLKKIKTGDLEFPENGATIFLKIDEIGKGTKISMKGPGIKDFINISLTVSKDFFETIKEINDFPMGVDLFFIDRLKNMIAIPRSVEVKVWDS